MQELNVADIQSWCILNYGVLATLFAELDISAVGEQTVKCGGHVGCGGGNR